ncbi:acetolactate synthase-1/2/3 large subunit [Nannocystis exedens]|uniref:Acetolactate synthase-1/2/3 large subunit n=1 Tax=Nannocystis exedens TaxID=54 RepID=A0A1I2I8S0_9BACT|nr:thiamine pyrophosphate-dependent enzyme [Nannocystis exedens]PCC74130.1 acetolactate synthase [Nannocystis exedens]SFF38053.1 acetolactate synthase-1/2/3 large subunit [Nannocystis exedens]
MIRSSPGLTPLIRPMTPEPTEVAALVDADAGSTTVAEALVQCLQQLGVRQAFGVVGAAIAPFCEALARSSIDYLHFRHEAGAAFAATEASLASDRPTAVFATTGPGLTNALTGMAAARAEGATVVLVSASTSPQQRGRRAAQETHGSAGPVPGLCTAGALFHYALTVEHASELHEVSLRLMCGVGRVDGFVAHLSLPVSVQGAAAPDALRVGLASWHPPMATDAAIDQCLRLLARSPFVIWVGYGARRARDLVCELVDRSGALVMCSPRGKGIFSERDPRFVGVTGMGGHAEVENVLREVAPQHVLVLGTRMGEGSSSWSVDLVPAGGFVHVDVDPDVFGAAYPCAPTMAVQAEIGAFLRALLAAWPADAEPAAPRLSRRGEWVMDPAHALVGAVRPRVLMAEVQRVVVDRSDALILAESGNSFAWANHCLQFEEPGRYRVSPSFGAMGQMATGVVGAALGRGGKAVALVGDGAMLMLSEVSSAVQYQVSAVWVILNDARYNMCHQGMRAAGWEPFGTAIPPTDFVTLARAVGADGVRVEREPELRAALETAMQTRGPFVVDVKVAVDEVAPLGRRNTTLFGAPDS